MTNELTTLQGTAVSATIADKELARLTAKLETNAASQKKNGWHWAYLAAQIKLLFGSKDSPARESITAQFPTIADYAKAIGLSPASIHNPAKAFMYMDAIGMLPVKETKDGKKVIDFDGFKMNTAQVIELARVPAGRFGEFEAECRQAGIEDLTCATSTVIRDLAKKFLGIEGKGRHNITDKSEQAGEQEEQASEQEEKQASAKVEIDTKEKALVVIAQLMAQFGITIDEVKKQVRA